MEAAVASALAKEVVLKLVTLLSERHKLSKGLKDDLRFIHTELHMILCDMDEHLGDPSHSSRRPQVVSMEEMRDLAHDIEDCIDRFLPCAACEGEAAAASVLRRVKKAVTGNRSRFAAEIRKLRQRVKDAHERRVNYGVNGVISAAGAGAGAAAPPAATDAAEADPVGIDKPRQELVELLLGSEPGPPSVISIVGFGGSGKTTLARAVYCCPGVVQRFPARAWAAGSEHTEAGGLLTAILRQLHHTAHVPQDQDSINNFLGTTECLIVIDDINKQHWDTVRATLHGETKSRIIVTTALHSVANACSSGDGYVYKMSVLDAELSRVLLRKKVFFGGCSPELERGSTAIVDKCDGLPLALVSVARFLLGKNELTGRHCAQVCRDLGLHMEKDADFTKLQQVLVNNYRSLSDYPLKTSLLYTSVFPNGHPIRKNTLIRRWLAEGYVQCRYKRSDLEVADENFQKLIDRNIIRPINGSNNTKVKTCKTHGIMHEFMLHKSMSDNFIASLSDQNRSKFCHLFIQNPASGSTLGLNHQHTSPASDNVSDSSQKFRARSLTIFGNMGEAAAEFCRCELLRVLDLEECDDLKDGHLKDIHKLWHVKYLSLGGTISNLPRNIQKLHCLETLDLRKTKIEILPVEVIGLPHLAHLFGKFKLGKDLKLGELEKFLPKKSKLQTLAGFVADENPGFLQLMSHMKELKKVKIWCCGSTDANNESMPHISEAVQKFAQDGMDTADVRSLSLDFGNSLGDFLGSIQEYCFLSSLKLRGRLTRLPQFVTSLCGLTELCLSSTNLVGNDLSNLCMMPCLLYLRLVEADLSGFIIKDRGFPSLLSLCLIVQIPVLPAIGVGALPCVVSLQLLCKDLVDLSGIKIEQHHCLQEVALDSMVSTKTVEMWETAVKKHPKRPKVLFLKRIDPSETKSTVKYVATDGPIREKASSIEFNQVQLTQNMLQNECIISLDQSSSMSKLNSAMKKIIVSEPPPAAPELSSAGNSVMPPSASIC
ncbi:disease resistance protein RGA4-like [Triticum dicoccoides]|uniref:disease resistance protein RGA4-like n=1 Tax=Triticum dicoccoides TaxID=85692 RepID=UPI001891C63C|nr:disease resistance protein RGA4-like [Triticum dicoccoides]